MTPGQTLITLDDVSYSYRTRKGLFRSSSYVALRGVSFSLCRGETLGIIGDNGAGKSTLLKILAHIFAPTSGTMTRHEKSLRISLLSLQLGFSPELTGMDNLILGAMFLGCTRKQAMDKADEIIRFAELEEWINEPLKTYSSGMRARLGFSVANELNPDILLVDEALGVGDRAFQSKSTAALKGKMNSDQTVVFVSHNANVMREICTRCVWLEKGAVKMEGATEEVLDRYIRSTD